MTGEATDRLSERSDAALNNLRTVANQWVGTPTSADGRMLSALIAVMDEMAATSRRAEQRIAKSEATIETLVAKHRSDVQEVTDTVRERLQLGVNAVSALHTINEKVVEKKLLEIVAAMTRDLKVSIENQATAMTSRYRWETHFRFLSYCSLILVFGFALGRFT